MGSISTNLVALGAESRELLAREYLMTAGRPIEAVKEGLSRLRRTLGMDRIVAGVGTTGSGRYMIGDFTGADVVRNEITAQARAAVEIDPDVDTIFEIGGQDSKYISIQNGRVVDFEMNKVCAAGTEVLSGGAGGEAGYGHQGVRTHGPGCFGPLQSGREMHRLHGERCIGPSGRGSCCG